MKLEIELDDEQLEKVRRGVITRMKMQGQSKLTSPGPSAAEMVFVIVAESAGNSGAWEIDWTNRENW